MAERDELAELSGSAEARVSAELSGAAGASGAAEASGAAQVIRTLAGRTVGCAESLTGGALCSALIDIPGASAVVRGGITAYATQLKVDLLGVDAQLLARVGPVDAQVAAQMARGAQTRLGAQFGVATTGVAGPGSSDGHPAGTVHLAVIGPGEQLTQRAYAFEGDRATVRRTSVQAALHLLLEHLNRGDVISA